MSIVRNRQSAVTTSGAVHPELVELGAERTAKLFARYAGAVTRIGLSFLFLWAFFDKTFGWGRATPLKNAWIHGGSPTNGFLSHAKGPFGNLFHSIAGVTFFDWLFMASLLGLGVALLFGIGMRIAAGSGIILFVLMWAASLPIATNPFLDDHLIYAATLVLLVATGAGRTIGLGNWWDKQKLVRRFPILR